MSQTAHEAIRLLLSEDEEASKTAGGDPDARRPGDHAAHLSQAARALRAGAARRGGQAEGTTRRRVSRRSSPSPFTMPVLLLHGSDDTVIPPTELLWLQRDIPKDQLLDALVSPAIRHVEVGSKVTLRERLALVHWMALMIREARTTEESRSTQNAQRRAGLRPQASSKPNPAMVTLEQIKLAQQRLRGIAVRTPLVEYFPWHRGTPSHGRSRPLWLKPESLQPIGSFKLRGAYNKIASLTGTRAAARGYFVLQRQSCARRRLCRARAGREGGHRDAAQCAEDQG